MGRVAGMLCLSGCSLRHPSTARTETGAVGLPAAASVATMAVVPVSIHDRDAVLIERLSKALSTAWTSESGGLVPIIPGSGDPFDAVRIMSDEFQRTGEWSEASIARFSGLTGCDYVLLLWVKNYGFGWREMTQTKEIRLGFVLASTRTGEARITGQGETVAAGRLESFVTLEAELLATTVATILTLVPSAGPNL